MLVVSQRNSLHMHNTASAYCAVVSTRLLTLGGRPSPSLPFSPPLRFPPLPYPSLSTLPLPSLTTSPLRSRTLNPVRGSGGALLAPPAGSGSPSRNRILCILALKSGIWWQLEAHIPLHCHPNIGGDIPIDVPANRNIGGDTSPASPAGLTPMVLCTCD